MAARRGRPGRPPPPRVVPPEEMLEKLHTILYSEVGNAVRTVTELEKSWTEGEMVKRIVRYIYKAASHEEVLKLPWEDGIKKFIVVAMQSYGASCQEKEWFYELDLAPVFQRAAWEVLQSHPERQGADYRIVEEVAEAEYQSYLDETLNNKAMWIAVAHVYSDAKQQGKVFQALARTYQVALDFVLADTRPLEDLQRLEIFLKKWMEDSLARAWNSVGEPERNLTDELAFKLFRKLMAPLGPNHAFSCVPLVLTERIGRPPEKWPFISNTIRNIFKQWRACQAQGNKKKKRKAQPDEDAVLNDEPLKEEALSPDPFMEETVEPSDRVEDSEDLLDEDHPEDHPAGHPLCTSAEDCQGSPDDPLVRHILNGKPGDLYCKTCWTSFLEQNPHLEGEEEP